MSPITISLFVFACVFGAALLGIFIHSLLPDHHMASDTKDVVRLGMGLVATMVALVLGLLIASSKGFYDSQNTGVTQMAANVVLLDRILAHYGPEANAARTLLRNSVAHQVETSWPQDGSGKTRYQLSEDRSEDLLDAIHELSPVTDSQKTLKSQALAVAIQIGQTRLLMIEQRTASVPTALLAMLIFWLGLLFASFGLFARPNITLVVSLLLAAVAVSGAIFLIVEMYRPYGGLIRVSDAPLRAAIAQLGK